MRRVLGLLGLAACLGCQSLDPTAAYREAARSLRFDLTRVEPRLDLAFPLDRSRLRIRLHMDVVNDSSVRFKARALGGALTLQVGDRTHALGKVGFPSGLDLAPKGKTEAVAELAFDYGALREVWGPLQDVVLRHHAATWKLDGEAQVEVYGLAITLPLRATRRSGDER